MYYEKQICKCTIKNIMKKYKFTSNYIEFFRFKREVELPLKIIMVVSPWITDKKGRNIFVPPTIKL